MGMTECMAWGYLYGYGKFQTKRKATHLATSSNGRKLLMDANVPAETLPVLEFVFAEVAGEILGNLLALVLFLAHVSFLVGRGFLPGGMIRQFQEEGMPEEARRLGRCVTTSRE